jgi:hypothetical protein
VGFKSEKNGFQVTNRFAPLKIRRAIRYPLKIQTKMTRAVLLPSRDYSILTPQQYHVVKGRSKPPEPDSEAIAEQARRKDTHTRLTTITSTWPNTIARNRLERQTRLQREAEAEEERRRQIDDEEKKVQKLRRQAKLAEASTIGFSQRPEVRSVNSQLLLHEVQLERDGQLLAKEQKRIAGERRQMEFDAEYRQQYEHMVEHEMAVLHEQEARALAVAEDLKRQKLEKEQQRQAQAEVKREEERILSDHFAWEVEQEKTAQSQARRRAKQFRTEVTARNAELLRYRESLAELEDIEEQRIKQERERVMDEEDERRAAEIKRKEEQLAARQSLIDAETRRQLATRREQQDFLDKQLEAQHEKEQQEIDEILEKRRRLAEERRREFLESRALVDKKHKTKKQREADRSEFPLPPAPEDAEMERRALARQKAARDAQDFQRQQIQEKKEREAAERERERLEWNHKFQQDEAFLHRAQEYACDLLKKAQEDEDNSDLSYYTDY